MGIKSLRFSMPDYPGRTTEVRIEIFHYKGGEVIGKIINIPSVWPEVVIDAPYADNKIGVGLSVFKAFPFFSTLKIFTTFRLNCRRWDSGWKAPASTLGRLI